MISIQPTPLAMDEPLSDKTQEETECDLPRRRLELASPFGGSPEAACPFSETKNVTLSCVPAQS
jgi:hypothetical protein